MRHVLLLLALLVATAGGVRAQLRPDARFWSPQTGALRVREITGNAAVPWDAAFTRVTFSLAGASHAAIFRRLERERVLLTRATIDDAGDGEYYTFAHIRVVSVATHDGTYASALHPSVTLTFGAHTLRCGPPTCPTPLHYP